jgi:hypothetical protein
MFGWGKNKKNALRSSRGICTTHANGYITARQI